MSLDRSTESLDSPSKDNFVPFASYRWTRSNTVRKVNSIGSSTPSSYTAKEENSTAKRLSADDIEVTQKILDNLNVEHGGREKLRKCLTDSAYRQSLESISEYKPKISFASQRLPSRECSSFESSSSDCTDYASKIVAGDSNTNNKSTILSDSSSYLSWIESLNSEYLTTTSTGEAITTDGKAGEWNNFWLNYNNARNICLKQNSFSCSTPDNTADDIVDARSTNSVQKEPSIENPSDLFFLTRSEILETIKCCQKIIEVLQTVLNKTSETKTDDTRKHSSYAIQQRSVGPDMETQRYSVVNLQKQKYTPQPKPNMPSTGSCINALFGAGVTDILKRVISKRRDSTENQTEPNISKNFFPNWTSSNQR